jgi:hypothetical protein
VVRISTGRNEVATEERIDESTGEPVVVERPVVDERAGRTTIRERLGRTKPVDDAPIVADDAETTDVETVETVEPVGPRPRSSLFATLSLIVGIIAVVAVLTGMLADVGVGVGILAAVLSIGGLSATRRRHVAGRFDAVLGLVLGLIAIMVGILAVTNSLSWLNLDTDTIPQVRDWLVNQWNTVTGR